LGLRDPEDVAYDPRFGRLFLVSRTDDVIVVATTAGALVDSMDISSPDLRPAGIALAPGSDDPTATHVYVADRGQDNGPHPAENDGRILEFALTPGPPDPAPPASPAELAISTNSIGVILDWADNVEPDLAGYEVYRDDGAAGTDQAERGSLTTSMYADGMAPPGATSDYRVIAFDTGGAHLILRGQCVANADRPACGLVRRRRSSRRLTIAHPEVPSGDVLVAAVGLHRTARSRRPPGGTWSAPISEGRSSNSSSTRGCSRPATRRRRPGPSRGGGPLPESSSRTKG
jgi:hypothetical protein